MSVQSLAYASKVSGVESVSASNAPAATSGTNTISSGGFDTAANLSPSSTPAITSLAYNTVALTAGAATIDLTNLTATGGGALSLSGLKIRVIKFKCPTGNAGNMTIAKGASNGWAPIGSTFSQVIPPGGEVTIYQPSGGTAVGSGAKNLDCSGTGTDTVNVTFGAGA